MGEGVLAFLLKLQLRENPRYMAGEFLAEALQKLENFKFDEVGCFQNRKVITSFNSQGLCPF